MRTLRFVPIALGLVAWSVLVSPATVVAQGRTTSDIDPELPQVRELMVAGRFAEAESLATVVLKRVERTVPDDAFAIGRVLDGLVEARINAGRITESLTRSLALRALEIREGLEPRESFVPTRNLAMLAHRLGDYREALAHAEQAVALARDHFPADSRERILSLNILSVVYYAMGDGERSLPPMEEAIRLLEQQPDSNPIEIAMLTQNVGGLEAELGHVDRASERIERAIELWDGAGVGNHPELARGLNYLGGLQFRRGDYAAARAAYERSLSMREQMLGPEHPELCWDLRGLADVLAALRDFETAELTYQRSIELRERSTGSDSSYLAFDLRGLGWVKLLQGQYEASHALYLRAEQLLRDSGASGYVMAATLRETAICEAHLGKLDAARKRLREALDLWTGLDSPLRADVLEAMGYLELMAENLELAETHFAQALEIARDSFGPDHPTVANILNGTSQALLRSGRLEAAMDAAVRAEEISRRNARLTSRWLEEETAVDLATRRSSGRDLILSILLADPDLDPRVALDLVVRSRAVVFDELASRSAVLYGATDSLTVSLATELSDVRSRMARLLVTRERDKFKELLLAMESARERKRELERALAARSLIFRTGLEHLELGLSEIESKLEADDVLVSYVRFDHEDRDPRTGSWRIQPRYAALVLEGGSGRVALISLERASVIDSLTASWRREIREGEIDPTRSPAMALRSYVEAGSALRGAIWDPIASRLSEAARVFVVPTGSIHFVSLATLPVQGDRFLIETGPLIHVLSTERDLVSREERRRGTGLLALGDPSFGAPDANSGAVTRGAEPDCPTLGDLRFAPLPASAQEGREVSRLWSEVSPETAQLLSGDEATEASFKRVAAGHRVLHLATHGFFLDPSCQRSPSSRMEALLQENPLLRSGLALAGANRRAATPASSEDGILTAEEIVALDLSGTEWAVLSACGTGLGAVAADEGVFGLRRAFLLAGAQSVIMSLWPVEDTSTRDWMTELYRQRFAQGAPTAEAVRAASLGTLTKRRSAGASVHPYHWGAFVAVGDWR